MRVWAELQAMGSGAHRAWGVGPTWGRHGDTSDRLGFGTGATRTVCRGTTKAAFDGPGHPPVRSRRPMGKRLRTGSRHRTDHRLLTGSRHRTESRPTTVSSRSLEATLHPVRMPSLLPTSSLVSRRRNT